MRAIELISHLRKQPFQPIRVFVSDGASYEIRHPELMLVTQNEVAIALGGSTEGPPERLAYCDPDHITRVEPMNGRKPKRRAPRRR